MSAAEFVTTLPSGCEAWRRGRVLFVVPTVPDGASPALKNALALRRSALLEGECGCGARLVVGHTSVRFDHRRNCPASDRAVRGLLESEGHDAR
jgi:hypothetical protein